MLMKNVEQQPCMGPPMVVEIEAVRTGDGMAIQRFLVKFTDKKKWIRTDRPIDGRTDGRIAEHTLL